MIVSCPRCHKQYRLDVSRLNYSRLPDNSGLGVQLACSNCHEQWWELKKDNSNHVEYLAAVPEQPFRNLTDISLLYQRQDSGYRHQNASIDSTFRISQKIEDRKILPIKSTEKNPAIKTSKWKILMWSIVILCGFIGFALAAMKFGQSSLFLTSTNHEATNQNVLVSPGDILIENINFDIQPIDGNQQKVIVAGNVKNPGPLAIPLHDIQITAWGGCTEGKTPNDQGLCEIRTWHYKWKQDLLQSGEQLKFQSGAKIPANLQVDQVDVDVAAN